MRITPQDIHRQEFNRSVRGYSVEEVDAFLEHVADELERVHQDNTKLRDQLKGLEASLAEYRRMEKNIERTLMAATKASDDMTRNTEEKRNLIIKEAELRADEIIKEAQRRRDEIKGELTNLAQQRITYLNEMRAFLQAQQNILEELDLHGFKGLQTPPQRVPKQPGKPDPNAGGKGHAPAGR